MIKVSSTVIGEVGEVAKFFYELEKLRSNPAGGCVSNIPVLFPDGTCIFGRERRDHPHDPQDMEHK